MGSYLVRMDKREGPPMGKHFRRMLERADEGMDDVPSAAFVDAVGSMLVDMLDRVGLMNGSAYGREEGEVCVEWDDGIDLEFSESEGEVLITLHDTSDGPVVMDSIGTYSTEAACVWLRKWMEG